MSNNIIISDNKILDGTNYHIWYDTIKSAAGEIELSEYLTTDKIKQCIDQHPGNQDELNKVKKENDKLRSIIINSINNKIHEEIIGIESVSVIIETLKTDYDRDKKDLTQWITKLKSIKAKNIQEIPKTIRLVKRVFQNMTDAQKTMDEKEKVKYLLHTLPENYSKKFILKESDTVDSLSESIEKDLNMWYYINNWDSDNSTYSNDDPMEIDFIAKNKKKNLKNNYKNKNKNKHNNNFKINKNKNKQQENSPFCEICEKGGHSTKECYFNPKNPRSKYYKCHNNNNGLNFNKRGKSKYAGYIGINLNKEYNSQICTNKNVNKNRNKKYLLFINRVYDEKFMCIKNPRVNKILCNIVTIGLIVYLLHTIGS